MDLSQRKHGVYAFGRFRLDTIRRTLVRDNVPIALTPRLFDTLLFLVENAGRLVEKDDIMNAVWRDRFVEERNITQTIFTLRKAMSGAGEEDRLIETVAGHGYRLNAPVRFEPVPLSAGAGAPIGDAAPRQPANPAPRRRRTAELIVAGVAGIALIVVMGFLAVFRHSPPARPPLQPNLVVLAGFDNLTGDARLGSVLDRVLEIDLAQSPFLTLMSEQRVRETLQMMERSPDSRLSPELAQEVCARNAGKAVVGGTIGTLGSGYIVLVEARDCLSGKSLARDKAEAQKREDLPGTLDRLSAQMRRGLNESLVSIRRYDVTIAQATTSSFEALTDFSLGEQLFAKGDYMGSMPLFKHAIELDPSFALAYEELGADYGGLREPDLVRPQYQKAFLLSGHTSENERLRIAATYYHRVGNFRDAINAYELWTRVYPRDWLPWARLANFLTNEARYSEAIEAGREALRLNPENQQTYMVLARAYKRATRLAEAKAICRQAVAKHLDGWDIHGLLYEISFAQGDRATMAEQVAKERGQPTESWMLDYEGFAAAAAGQLRRARPLFAAAIEAARDLGPDARDEVTTFTEDYIGVETQLATPEDARNIASRVPRRDQTALTLAEIGDDRVAEALIASLSKSHQG